MKIVEFGGKNIVVDKEGFLMDIDDWSKELADFFAELEGIKLDDDQWWYIDFLRSHYIQNGTYPLIPFIVSNARLHLGPEKGTTKHMWDKFPGGGLMICRFAGLPRPIG